jgi:hypothetical protein
MKFRFLGKSEKASIRSAKSEKKIKKKKKKKKKNTPFEMQLEAHNEETL